MPSPYFHHPFFSSGSWCFLSLWGRDVGLAQFTHRTLRMKMPFRCSKAKHCSSLPGKAQQDWPWSSTVPGTVPVSLLPPHYHVLLNNFSTVYLKINKTKDWGWRSSTWGTQGRGNPCCCCCGKGGRPCWACWASRAGYGEWPVPHDTSWTSSEPPFVMVNVPAAFQPSFPSSPSIHGWFPQHLTVSQHASPAHVLLSALKCHSSYVWHFRLKFSWVIVVSQLVWFQVNFRRGKNWCHF